MGRDVAWQSNTAHYEGKQFGRSRLRVHDTVQIVIGATVCLLAGSFVGEQRMATRAHVSGACIALEIAQAQGALDSMQTARVRAGLVTAVNPYQASFPVTYEQFSRQCGALSAWGASRAQPR